MVTKQKEIEIKMQLNDAEDKAWRSLSKYKFMMFGYWASIWVHLNKMLENQRRNPFAPLVDLAREREENGKDG